MLKAFALAALVYGVVMAASLYKNVKDENANDGWAAYLSTVLIAVGSFSCVVTAIKVLFS